MVLILGFPFELFLYRCVKGGHCDCEKAHFSVFLNLAFFVSFSHSCSIVSTMAQLFNLSSLAYLGHLCRPASLATG